MKSIAHLSDFIDHFVQHLELIFTFLLVGQMDELLQATLQHRTYRFDICPR